MDTVTPEDQIVAPVSVQENPKIQVLDACLADVTSRSTVYAREIFTPLESIDDPAVEICVAVLKGVVSHVDGTDYLHYRDFLDPLLDLRAALKA